MSLPPPQVEAIERAGLTPLLRLRLAALRAIRETSNPEKRAAAVEEAIHDDAGALLELFAAWRGDAVKALLGDVERRLASPVLDGHIDTSRHPRLAPPPPKPLAPVTPPVVASPSKTRSREIRSDIGTVRPLGKKWTLARKTLLRERYATCADVRRDLLPVINKLEGPVITMKQLGSYAIVALKLSRRSTSELHDNPRDLGAFRPEL